MKTVSALTLLTLTVTPAAAFQTFPLATERASGVVRFAYVPDGFTKESYAKFKADEAKKKQKKKNLGELGPKGFQSRSFQSFQEALERGEAKHLMPVTNAKKRIAAGELREEDIPYMQRGGKWDNTDVKGAKKVLWSKSDKSYAKGGYAKEQSVSIFGSGAGLDWTGKRDRTGPAPAVSKFKKNYQPPNVKDLKKKGKNSAAAPQQEPKKKFFGLF